MKTNELQSRRSFIGLLAAGVATSGLALIPETVKANIASAAAMEFSDLKLDMAGAELDGEIKRIGRMQHPVAYDISQAIPWGIIWTNVYYMTNEATGTPSKELGVFNVLRHHGMIFAMNDETIEKYKLGEFVGYNDPATNEPALRNTLYDPEEGFFPVPGLTGIKGLQSQGALFCVCDMARQVNAMFVAKKMGLKTEDVYEDFVNGTLPGIVPAPSGVWALGRLAENKIAYIDASVG